MQELNVTRTAIHFAALDRALKIALGEKCLGVSTYGNDRPISVWLTDDVTQDDRALATTIGSTHDPVFLSVDKRTIIADGADTATILVDAQNDVSLLVAGVSVPVTLINGLGTVQITSDDPARITITVAYPTNRSTDSITIEAI